MSNTVQQIQTDSYPQPFAAPASVERLVPKILTGALLRFSLLLGLGVAASFAATRIVELAVREQAFGPAMATLIAFYCSGIGASVLANRKRSA